MMQYGMSAMEINMRYRQPFDGSYPITYKFNERADGQKYAHKGIDWGLPEGTPVLSATPGIVQVAGVDKTGYGNLIIISHGVGGTVYAHLSDIRVTVGQEVAAGEVIGLSGNTGNSTGAHLHFEVRTQWDKIDTVFDPLDVLNTENSDDTAEAETVTAVQEQSALTVVHQGLCRVVCGCARVRSVDDMTPLLLVRKGVEVYAFNKFFVWNGLPFRLIGAGLCIAEYDSEGTRILENVE